METIVNLHYVGPRGTRQNEKELAKVPTLLEKNPFQLVHVSPLADLIKNLRKATRNIFVFVPSLKHLTDIGKVFSVFIGFSLVRVDMMTQVAKSLVIFEPEIC